MMRGRWGILSPRQGPEVLGDLAERGVFVAGQRVPSRRRRGAERRGPGRARRLALGVAFALLTGGLLALLNWFLTSPRFAVSQVEIRGLTWLREAEVRAAAGIAPGQNLFTLDGEAVARQLARLPRVKRAQLIRSLPNHVTLLIEERPPFALAVSVGRLYWLDEEGRVLGPEAQAVAPGLPVITGLAREEQADGFLLSAERIQDAMALLRTILRTGSPLAARLSEIDVGQADEGPVLYSQDGIEVRLGSEWSEERLGRLEGVLAQLQAEQEPVATVDLRFRDQVVLGLKR
jgi:cell division protein FtsQ